MARTYTIFPIASDTYIVRVGESLCLDSVSKLLILFSLHT